MTKTAKVFFGERLAGRITEGDFGYSFVYDPDYLKSVGAQPVSLTLPLKEGAYYSKTLFPFFDGLIPEGWLLNIAKEHWKIQANDRFEILLAACRDTIGAVTIQPENE